MSRGLFLAALFLVGCPKSKPAASVDEVRALARPAGEVHYTRVNVAELFDLPPVPIREILEGPAFDGDRVLYDVISENALTGKVLDVTRVFYGPEGYGYLGTVMSDGKLEVWDPAQIVLPANPKVGDRWSAEHRKGSSLSSRSCEILPGEACGEGLVVVCESSRDGGTIILRDHFCPGIGWSGFEALVQAPGAPVVRMWSEGVVRDGKAAPSFQTPAASGPAEPGPAPPAEVPDETPEAPVDEAPVDPVDEPAAPVE
ncbi:MAG: hypothetical protein EP330_09120 [Deltaproteobacteria bacterium]|nr:MAG: hypothetical protein EP330_09120 [Deltaproteobacteria bacterium]